MGRPKKLIAIDVDGVLLNNKQGSIKDMLIILGLDQEVELIDQEYQKRKHLGPWGLEKMVELYAGQSKENLDKIALEYCQNNLMSGAVETTEALKEQGYIVGAVSSNPWFILESLAEIVPLDFIIATKLEYVDGKATGKIEQKVDRNIKVERLKQKIEEYEVAPKETIVVGDSITDLPMAELVGLFIAFNAKKEAQEKADIVIENKDLKEVLKHVK